MPGQQSHHCIPARWQHHRQHPHIQTKLARHLSRHPSSPHLPAVSRGCPPFHRPLLRPRLHRQPRQHQHHHLPQREDIPPRNLQHVRLLLVIVPSPAAPSPRVIVRTATTVPHPTSPPTSITNNATITTSNKRRPTAIADCCVATPSRHRFLNKHDNVPEHPR